MTFLILNPNPDLYSLQIGDCFVEFPMTSTNPPIFRVVEKKNDKGKNENPTVYAENVETKKVQPFFYKKGFSHYGPKIMTVSIIG